jgi:signal peptidase I
VTPTTPRRPDRDPDDWLAWETEGDPHGEAAADAVGSDPAVETTGPWLRHDLDAGRPLDAEPPSAWLEPDVSLPEAPAPDESHDTGVPPTTLLPTVAPTEVLRAVQAHAGPTAYQDGPADDAEPVTGPRSRARSRSRDEQPSAGALGVLAAAVKEFAIVVGMALVLSFVVKTWLLQAFYIPSGSMEDTLQVNDRVIVSKLTPGPIDLKRGDIIVFGDPGDWLEPPVEESRGKAATVVRDTLIFVGLLPDDAENHLIKRVIGLPGDRIVCCDKGGRLTVNGQPIKEPYLKPGVAPSDQDFDITVPRGRVWVMGDNRSGSSDSRAHDGPDNDGRLGSVDERLIVGRAVALVWPLDHLTWLSNPSSVFRDVPAPKPSDVVEDTPPEDGGTDAPTDGGG